MLLQMTQLVVILSQTYCRQGAQQYYTRRVLLTLRTTSLCSRKYALSWCRRQEERRQRFYNKHLWLLYNVLGLQCPKFTPSLADRQPECFEWQIRPRWWIKNSFWTDFWCILAGDSICLHLSHRWALFWRDDRSVNLESIISWSHHLQHYCHLLHHLLDCSSFSPLKFIKLLLII